MDLDLSTYLRPPERGDMTLERFIGECLAAAGIWTRWRESDGITKLYRYERIDERFIACGRIIQITDQVARYFWLEVVSRESLRWTLGLDPHSGSERRAGDDLENSTDLASLDWEVCLVGTAEIQDGALVPTSARSLPRRSWF